MKRTPILILALLAFAWMAASACTKTFDDPDQAILAMMQGQVACVDEEPEDCDEAYNKIVACSEDARALYRDASRQSMEMIRKMTPDELTEYREGPEAELIEVMEEYVEALSAFGESCPKYKRPMKQVALLYRREKKSYKKAIADE
mgnify:CR=1 FL=1